MTNRPPAPRHLLISITLAVLLIAAAVPVGASMTTRIEIEDYAVITDNYNMPTDDQGASFTGVCFNNPQQITTPFTLIWFGSFTVGNPNTYSNGSYVNLGGKGDGYLFFQRFPSGGGQSFVSLTVNNLSASGTNELLSFSGLNPGFESIYATNAITRDHPNPSSGRGVFYNYHPAVLYDAVGGSYTMNRPAPFKNVIAIDSDDEITPTSTDAFVITKVFDGKGYTSQIIVLGNNDVKYLDATNTVNSSLTIAANQRPYTIAVKSTLLNRWYNSTVFGADPGDPGDPGDAILRTGTVTMTDNNGTTITGFEVTAINAYTGENYTVSTETDVAVMTLPMDRTIDIRNPQTGEYEKAPIGYYRFYGQASGYKMLNEGGIQVAVMPEKYSTYKFCDIGVTSESGYLTGKHQFQIRSRSDNSILQTGTVSAKSATTGDWYNTTVSGGIATLILPYDTSNSQSQYAGNYYVYATSPGYEDSDYGTQIVVTPRTVSETRIILLTPAGGIPTPGNVTLRIQVFSETGPGVVNAEIFIAGVQGAGASVWDTYTASSTGYLTVSVPGNSTYDIVASGAGYYDSARRIEVLTDDPPLIEIKLYLSGAPTVEPTTQPTGWPTTQPTTQPPGGIPDEDDDSEGFLMQAVRGIGLAFGVGFATAKLIFGMLLALSIGYTTAKQLRGGAAEFGLGLLGGTLLGVLIGLLPVWIIVVLLLVVGLYIGNRYVGGGSNNG